MLTRPKDQNKRRVILYLSFPNTLSLNDKVNKHAFGGDAFRLKFPSVDDIVKEIVTHGGNVTLDKVNVARALRNLRVDPADALKLGIKWGNDAYNDASMAFGWVHGSPAFQSISEAIMFIFSKAGIKMFVCIDYDYVLVSVSATAVKNFDTLTSILSELGLPSNSDKQLPPPPPPYEGYDLFGHSN